MGNAIIIYAFEHQAIFVARQASLQTLEANLATKNPPQHMIAAPGGDDPSAGAARFALGARRELTKLIQKILLHLVSYCKLNCT